jgi:hypothetical protein
MPNGLVKDLFGYVKGILHFVLAPLRGNIDIGIAIGRSLQQIIPTKKFIYGSQRSGSRLSHYKREWIGGQVRYKNVNYGVALSTYQGKYFAYNPVYIFLHNTDAERYCRTSLEE